MYISLHCHHQNDSCIKMGSDESHFNVSVNVRDKITRQAGSTNHNLFEETGEPKPGSEPRTSAYQPNALPLGQTGFRAERGGGQPLLSLTRYRLSVAHGLRAALVGRLLKLAACRQVIVRQAPETHKVHITLRASLSGTFLQTPSIAFRHLPPNSAKNGYATEVAFFISAQMSTDAVRALGKVWVQITLRASLSGTFLQYGSG